jgi:hypothetical protein
MFDGAWDAFAFPAALEGTRLRTARRGGRRHAEPRPQGDIHRARLACDRARLSFPSRPREVAHVWSPKFSAAAKRLRWAPGWRACWRASWPCALASRAFLASVVKSTSQHHVRPYRPRIPPPSASCCGLHLHDHPLCTRPALPGWRAQSCSCLPGPAPRLPPIDRRSFRFSPPLALLLSDPTRARPALSGLPFGLIPYHPLH